MCVVLMKIPTIELWQKKMLHYKILQFLFGVSSFNLFYDTYGI
jgi:hypothetical protein